MKISTVVKHFLPIQKCKEDLYLTVNLFVEKCNIQDTLGRSQIGRVDILVPHSFFCCPRGVNGFKLALSGAGNSSSCTNRPGTFQPPLERHCAV